VVFRIGLGREVGESMGVLDRLEWDLDCLWKVPRSWYSNYIGSSASGVDNMEGSLDVGW